MAPPGNITTVTQLKESLSKEIPKMQGAVASNTPLSSKFYERCLDILKCLDDLPIDLKTLSSTLIGTVVSKFKSCPDPDVASTAKKIVKKWKAVAKGEGVSKPPPAAKAISAVKPSNPSPARVVRRSSSTSQPTPAPAPAPTPEEWKSLPPLRRNICTKLHSIILLSAQKYKDANPISTSTEIESAMNTHFRGPNDKYKEKARSLCFNMKRNTNLCDQIVDGTITPSRLIEMSTEELATSERKAEKEKLEKMLVDSRRLDWEQQNEDKINEMCGIKGDLLNASLFTCSRCKSIKTTSTQKQTRSADEPMTVFVYCTNCGKRWKC